MEKVGDEAATKFINALIKSVQTLCHGYLEFSSGIEIIGHINLMVDKGTSLDYILKEKVCKNAENSTLFISNSFHAEPKCEQEVSGKNSQQPGNQVVQNKQSTETGETGRLSSAISSISSALSGSRERSRRSSGTKDSDSSHSQQSTTKRKASDDHSSEFRPSKVSSHHDNVSHSSSESPFPPTSSSPVDSKAALQQLGTSEADMSETMLPQTANVTSDSSADIGVNLAGSVLEPVDDQSNPDLADRDDDSDGDLEVTFIKEEYVEGERSACEYENSSGQQFVGGPHQRGSESMPDPSLFPVALHTSSSASATYVPSAHDLGAGGQHFPPGSLGPSTSQPQPGPSSMRGLLRRRYGAALSTRGHQGSPQTLRPSEPGTSQSSLQRHDATLSLAAGSFSGQEELVPPKTALLCQYCNAILTTRQGLNKHINHFHLNKFLYRCDVCDKGFTVKDHYEDHLNMHNNVRVHRCPRCSCGFAFKSGLRRHLRKGVCSKERTTTTS